jgi:hypothetical protein
MASFDQKGMNPSTITHKSLKNSELKIHTSGQTAFENLVCLLRRGFFRIVFGAVSLIITLPACGALAGPEPLRSDMVESVSVFQPDAVGFAIKFADGELRRYRTSKEKIPPFIIEDERIYAKITSVGDFRWELNLDVRDGSPTQVWFPWEDKALPLDDDIKEDLVLYPYLMGVAKRAESLKSYSWWGLDYPGPCISPLVVITNKRKARITAATNWPPRRVKPIFCREGVALWYTDLVRKDFPASFGALILDVHVAPSYAGTPWQVALDYYKNWLKSKMQESGLWPTRSPEWMLNSHGFINVQLENMTAFHPEILKQKWQDTKEIFPWVQFWGQMSNYAGPTAHATPKLMPGERTGCCLPIPRIHQRYLPDLTDIAKQIGNEGHVGYYARPEKNDLLDEDGKQFLTNWLQANKENGANVFYIDVLGGRFFGEPLDLSRFLSDRCPTDTFIERLVDVYPTAFLVSGSLSGGDWAGGPRAWGRFFVGKASGTTYPEFGRYLMNDRLIFLGQSNGDFAFWGPKNDYWTERQAFLLGAKFDIINVYNDQNTREINHALKHAVGERNRVGWWQRNPVYLHRDGITDIPEGVDIRIFKGSRGENLIAIDNWNQLKDVRFRHSGNWLTIPSKPLSILVQ